MDSSIRRHALGVVALVLLVSAPVLFFRYDLFGFEANVGEVASSICMRVGLTLGALWLAFPQILAIKSKYPPRLLLAVLGGSFVVIAYPRSFPIVLVLVALIGAVEALGWFLKPPPGKKARRRSRPRR